MITIGQQQTNSAKVCLSTSSRMTILYGCFCITVLFAFMVQILISRHLLKFVDLVYKEVKRCFIKKLITLLDVGVENSQPILSILLFGYYL